MVIRLDGDQIKLIVIIVDFELTLEPSFIVYMLNLILNALAWTQANFAKIRVGIIIWLLNNQGCRD